MKGWKINYFEKLYLPKKITIEKLNFEIAFVISQLSRYI